MYRSQWAAGVAVSSVIIYAIRRRALSTIRKSADITVYKRPEPPVLKKKPQYVAFGAADDDVENDRNRGSDPMVPPRYLKDDYYYVRDDSRTNKDIIRHLEKENEYTHAQTSHLSSFREDLYQELLSHVKETDAAYPYPWGSYKYFTKTVKGKSYAYYCRTASNSTVEEVVLDVNALASGQAHCEVGSVQPSPDHTILAYTVDHKGYETYTTHFKNLSTGEMLPYVIPETAGRVCWGKDNLTVYYSTMDDAHRVNKIWRHVLGTEVSSDECLMTEDDEVFSASFGKTLSGRFIVLGSGSSETDEYRFIDLEAPDMSVPPRLIQKREFGVQYSVDHHGSHFYIVTNRDNATNFKLMKAPIESPSGDNWEEAVPYDSKKKTDYVECFKNFIVIAGREEGLTQLWVMDMRSKSKDNIHRLTFEEPLFSVGASVNKEFNTDKFRLTYSSLTTPATTYDYNMETRKLVFLKEKPVPNYDRSLYVSEKAFATSADGAKIPLSIVYRKDKAPASGTPGPVHLYGYGSYEICIDPDFRMSILPLLDHGATFVIAHIRGGGEMGRSWYEDAKYLSKRKTFEDFCAAAQHLVSSNRTTPSQLTCEGRSAGGLLVGAVLNMRPDLFKAAIAGVPFVDVMNSMCDSTIPLTTGEWEEWGNPNEAKYFDYMLSYSPYENVSPQDYPNILVTSGLYDPRVAYWEPTKWVAKLRSVKTDSNTILLKMDLSSGHFSASDRYHYLREKAFDIAYLLDQLGLGPKED